MGETVGVPDATDSVTAAIQALFRLGSSRRIHQQQAGAAGISVSSQALRVLERVAESGRTTPGELAGQLELDPATVTRLLRQLEDAGLVARRRGERDGRILTVEVSDDGAAAIWRYRQVIWDQVRRSLAAWPEADVRSLAGLLSRLVADVQKEPYRPLSSPTGNVSSNRSDR